MYRLDVESEFSAAHQLREHGGKCENLHGHNWRVLASVCGNSLDNKGMLVDFSDLKRLLESTLDRLDHAFLNEIPPFDSVNPTSERLARHIAETVGASLPEGVRVQSVTVWESDRCSATYQPQP